EREHEERGPRETEEEDEGTRGRLAASDLRQPQPRMERGQNEEQCKRVCCQYEQRNDAECEQRRGLAREPLVDADAPPWHEAMARDDPAAEHDDAEPEQREHRPVAGSGRGRVRW